MHEKPPRRGENISSNKSSRRLSQTKYPYKSVERVLSTRVFLSLSPFPQRKNNNNPKSLILRDSWDQSGSSCRQIPSAVGCAVVSSPRLGSRVYSQFSQTGCDAAHWTSTPPRFIPLFCKLTRIFGA